MVGKKASPPYISTTESGEVIAFDERPTTKDERRSFRFSNIKHQTSDIIL